MIRLALVLALLPLAAPAQTIEDAGGTVVTAGRADGSEAGFRQWVTAFRTSALAAGIPAAVYDREMRAAAYLPDVVRRDRNQNEFTKTIWDYLDIAVSDDRVTGGKAALTAQAATLDRIAAEYGVPAEIVVAVWGLETSFGSWRGTTDTVSALATLAYDGRRAAFFATQTLQALRILDKAEVTRAAMVGSWAGAMGHTQFMPTSWADFAVDFNGDGRRDIWGDDPGDALASTARYLRDHGWTPGQPWGMEVRLPTGFDYGQTTEQIRKPAAAWRALGVTPIAGGALPDGDAVSILLPAGVTGPAFAIWPNFRAIEAYNPADAYVIGIGHLADRISGGAAITADWPRHWQALTLEERKALQHLLTEAGFDAGGVDGRIGPKTVAAVQGWQRSTGRVPDGYASPDVLAALRGG